jgi:hypothetical protein
VKKLKQQNPIIIDPLSASSLKIEAVTITGITLSTATGFVITHNNQYFLVTNWHVVSGRNTFTNQVMHSSIATPELLHVYCHSALGLGNWNVVRIHLYKKSGAQNWLEHPFGRSVDIVLIKLHPADDLQLYSLNLNLSETDIVPTPAMSVSIIGYPYGLSTEGLWPIWKTGHIASDPELDYNGHPAFLIDATTRGGMSGSPVIIRMSSGYNNSAGTHVIGEYKTKFLGVYSGRIHEDLEIGLVWRTQLIYEILTNAGF